MVAEYSINDRTRLKYAVSFSFGGAFFRLRRKNPSVLLAIFADS